MRYSAEAKYQAAGTAIAIAALAGIALHEYVMPQRASHDEVLNRAPASCGPPSETFVQTTRRFRMPYAPHFHKSVEAQQPPELAAYAIAVDARKLVRDGMKNVRVNIAGLASDESTLSPRRGLVVIDPLNALTADARGRVAAKAVRNNIAEMGLERTVRVVTDQGQEQVWSVNDLRDMSAAAAEAHLNVSQAIDRYDHPQEGPLPQAVWTKFDKALGSQRGIQVKMSYTDARPQTGALCTSPTPVAGAVPLPSSLAA